MSNSKEVLDEIFFNNILMDWNRKINLVSRKKTDVFDLIEESKLFFKYINFFEGVRILDLGTGGGFPGIPIYIHHPETKMTLVDSTKKKVDAVRDIVDNLGYSNNVEAVWSRAEDLYKLNKYKNRFDYVVSRSVAPLFNLTKWSRHILKKEGEVITIKGGVIWEEIDKTKRQEFIKNVYEEKIGDRIAVVVRFNN